MTNKAMPLRSSASVRAILHGSHNLFVDVVSGFVSPSPRELCQVLLLLGTPIPILILNCPSDTFIIGF